MLLTLLGGATAANKSGYSSTIICGSNAAGEPIPPHFQLKTAAQTDEGQRLSVDWFTNVKNIVAKFGYPERRPFPCTFGMNEKAGMNSVELDKYINNSIVPLYPDIADTAGKRVIMKVDSGPGRMNLEMLARLKLIGLYLIPGVPNTTGQTQETDQNYGPFKGSFRGNIRTLSQARFAEGLSVRVTDLPLLVFGGRCASTGVLLNDSFSLAFSTEANLSCWRKCGAVPLTRLPIESPHVRHEIPVGAAARLVVGEEENPQVKVIRDLESSNRFYCDILLKGGYDGNHLRKLAPRRQTYVAVTEPHSKERVKAIKNCKTAGQMFFATGGKHLNSDEFFLARELKKRDGEIKEMEAKKAERAKYCKEQKNAVLMIRKKGELTVSTEKHFTVQEIKTLLHWKKAKQPSSTKKRDLVNAYLDTPKPKIQKTWTRGEEAALVQLKREDIPLIDTALGVATTQMATAVQNNLAQLDKASIELLKTALDDHSDSQGPNVL
jgi:hypothetical protein